MCSRKHNIIISNINQQEVITYSVILLRGQIKNPNSKFTQIHIGVNRALVEIINISDCEKNEFKYLLKLNAGKNVIFLKHCCTKKYLIVFLNTPITSKYIEPLYIICNDHDGTYQSMEFDNSWKNACTKITIVLHLIQCLYAEKLWEQGFGRKTFQINGDCKPFYSELNVTDAENMSPNQLWEYFAREIVAAHIDFGNLEKYIAFIGCTRYDGITDNDYSIQNIRSKTKANAALGGGNLAIFGTGCLYSWPASLSEVISCFQSERLVDRKVELDDSNGRRTYGGCFATTFGSVCHEIGHIFDLGHTKDGIMGNGFDYMNRVFTIRNRTDFLPERLVGTISGSVNRLGNKSIDKRLTKISLKESKFLSEYQRQKGNFDMTFFNRASAIILSYHKWINIKRNELPTHDSNYFSYDILTGVIKSNVFPIRLIEIRETLEEIQRLFYSFLDQDVYTFQVRNIDKETTSKDNQVLIFVIDDNGNVAKMFV